MTFILNNEADPKYLLSSLLIVVVYALVSHNKCLISFKRRIVHKKTRIKSLIPSSFVFLINNRRLANVPVKIDTALAEPLFLRKLFSDTQFFDNGTIPFNIDFNQVIE